MTEEQKSNLPQNAAVRALRVVSAIKSVSPTMFIKNQQVAVANISWFKVYQELFMNVSPLAMSGRLHSLIRTFQEVEKFITSGEIKGLVHKHKHFRALMGEIEASASNLSGYSSQIPFNFEVAELILEICASNMPEEPALGNDAQKILQELERCREEIQNSNLDADIKEFCLRHLAEMICALREYGIMGRESIQQVVMSLANEVDKMPAKKKEGFPQKFKDATRLFVGATKDLNALGQFGEKIAGYLEKLGG